MMIHAGGIAYKDPIAVLTGIGSLYVDSNVLWFVCCLLSVTSLCFPILCCPSYGFVLLFFTVRSASVFELPGQSTKELVANHSTTRVMIEWAGLVASKAFWSIQVL